MSSDFVVTLKKKFLFLIFDSPIKKMFSLTLLSINSWHQFWRQRLLRMGRRKKSNKFRYFNKWGAQISSFLLCKKWKFIRLDGYDEETHLTSRSQLKTISAKPKTEAFWNRILSKKKWQANFSIRRSRKIHEGPLNEWNRR